MTADGPLKLPAAASQCPICGQSLPWRTDIMVSLEHNVVRRGNRAIVLTPRETEFVYALWKHGKLTREQIALKIWGATLTAANGHEIKDPRSSVSVLVHDVRIALAPIGVTVSSKMGMGEGGYWLELVEMPK